LAGVADVLAEAKEEVNHTSYIILAQLKDTVQQGVKINDISKKTGIESSKLGKKCTYIIWQ